jgi:acyl-lipid omega-6 desaturase (Delta-12 desaturase)
LSRIGMLELREPLKALRSQAFWWAAFLFSSAAVAYVVCFVAAAHLDLLWVRVLCSLALGPLIALLFRIAHDAGHECHFASRRLNRWTGRLSILPSYHPYSVWLHFHNGRHHAFTNLRTRDYIWVPLTKREYDELSIAGRALERAYRTGIGVGLYYLYEVCWRKMLFPSRAVAMKARRDYVFDSFIVLLFFGLQLAVLAVGATSAADFAGRFALAVGFPFVVFCWLVGFASFLNHTHPQVPWFARRAEWSFYIGQVHCTVHMEVPKWMVFFLTDVGLHGAHHVDPRVPIWGLDKAEPRIRATAKEEIIAEKWTYRRHREIMRCCKLYDYDAHRWLDFRGRPTAPPIPVRAGVAAEADVAEIAHSSGGVSQPWPASSASTISSSA